MHIDLPQVRAACQKSAALTDLLNCIAAERQVALMSLEWCEQKLERRRTPTDFASLFVAFQALEAAGFGRIIQPTVRARARFEWAVMPLAVAAALRTPEGSIEPHQVLPAAAGMGLALPPPPLPHPERAGWSRHALTLRPGQAAELFLPEDLTPREAAWLGDFLLRMADATTGRARPAKGGPVATEKGAT